MPNEVIPITPAEVVLYQPNETLSLEVKIEQDTVWLSQAQMVELFQTTKQNVSLHINNIFKEGELEREPTVKDYLTVQKEGSRTVRRKVAYYNPSSSTPISSPLISSSTTDVSLTFGLTYPTLSAKPHTELSLLTTMWTIECSPS